MSLENQNANCLANTKPDKIYLKPSQIPSRHPAFSEASIRYLIFNAETNGFKKCIKRLGRKLLIEEGAFLEFLENQNA